MSFCTNCGKQNPGTSKFCTNCGAALTQSKTIESEISKIPANTPQPVTLQSGNISQTHPGTHTIPQGNDFEVGKWVNKNKNALIYTFGLAVVLFAGYYFFLRHDPVKDAKKAASTFCECSTKYNTAMIKVNEAFIDSFNSYNFKKRQIARSKLAELQNSANTTLSDCNQKGTNRYNELRKRYVMNAELLNKFDLTFTSKQGGCSPSNLAKLTSTSSEVENKILTINDPEPDIPQIKSDLIGKQIPGWNFESVSEIDKIDISSVSRSSGRIEYVLNLHLVGMRANDPHDAQINVAYTQDINGWYFNSVKEMFITFTNTAPVNTWQIVTPLQNCSYTITDNGQKFWVEDGSNGPKYKGGGNDADPYYLRSTQIFLMSRENHPVDLVFKYIPNQ